MQIDKAVSYILSLKDTKKQLDNVSQRLGNKGLDPEEYQMLYEKEFYLSMRLSGIYEDAHIYLDNIKNNDIMVRKYKKELDGIFRPLMIELERKS